MVDTEGQRPGHSRIQWDEDNLEDTLDFDSQSPVAELRRHEEDTEKEAPKEQASQQTSMYTPRYDMTRQSSPE